MIPTLVAASMAPRKACSIHDSSGRNSSPTPKPSSIGSDYAHDGDESGATADSEHLAGRRLQAHVKQQQDRSELGHRGHGLARRQRREIGTAQEYGVAGQNAHDQLAEHRGLPQPLDELSGELGPDDREGQGQQQGRYGAAVVAGAGVGQQEIHVHAVLRC